MADGDTDYPLGRPTMWFGSDRWGRHVEGEQARIRGCCNKGMPVTRRFVNVMNFTDIAAFYRDLRKNYRTGSTEFLRDNPTCCNVGRYALNFFRGRGNEDVIDG